MSWTCERVERLSRLWLEGMSASQIAADLGEGVSRNAVIGKVHRLGLSGRAANAGPDAVLAGDELPAPVQCAAAPAPAPTAEVAIDEDDEIQPEVEHEVLPVPVAIDLGALRPREMALPTSGRVTILELGATMCRWPLGDPTSAEFRFCGCRVVNGLPYCPEHARVAFQPVTDRRRVERMIRTA